MSSPSDDPAGLQVFEIRPRVEIGPVELGMSRDRVRAALGDPSAVEEAHERWGIDFPAKDMFFRNAFQVSYDAELRAEFIEVSGEAGFSFVYGDLDVHRCDPDALVAAIAEVGAFDASYEDHPVNLWFPTLGLSLWRSQSEDGPFEAVGIAVEGYGGSGS